MDAFERTTKMANLMSFNLECVALVQVRGEADEESPSITIHSFWSSSAAAHAEITVLREQLPKLWSKEINSFFGAELWGERDYKAGRFFVIPLTGARFKNFYDLEEAIEAAALAAWRTRERAAVPS